MAQRASEHLVGRSKELSDLSVCLSDAGPLVTHLHGLAGVGKSTLLALFSVAASKLGAAVVSLDARLIEPTPSGFLAELSRALSSPVSTCEDAADLLARQGSRVVLILDSYELLRLLDTWMRQVFLPALDSKVRVVLGSRHPPAPPWLIAPEWQGLFRSMQLGPMPESEALELLAQSGWQGDTARRLNRFAKGHPLALRLAAAAAVQVRRAPHEDFNTLGVVQHLTDLYLAEITAVETRIAIEAASVLRRVTKSLIEAILPGEIYANAYDRLAGLAFVESSRDGLMMHDAVRESVCASLRSAHPARYGEYRRAAWRQLRSEVRAATRDQMWRYTADMLFLLQNPNVREAFFPSGQQYVSVEPALAADRAAIFGIVRRHESKGAASILKRWWDLSPASFHVTRDASGGVVGFYVMTELRKMDRGLLAIDPLLRGWHQHIQDEALALDETAVFLRRWLDVACGELPSVVQAECWLDVKRSYMELRSRLRRCYISLCDLTTYGPTAAKLGFRHVEKASIAIDGVMHHLAVLDFGPGSVDGWLSALVAEELGEEREALVDAGVRELILDRKRIPLTPLEFGVFDHLLRNEGRAVSRTELLDRIWGPTYEGGSNVVDVVVRSLRKKLGNRAELINTIRGLGYRFRDVPSSSTTSTSGATRSPGSPRAAPSPRSRAS